MMKNLLVVWGLVAVLLASVGCATEGDDTYKEAVQDAEYMHRSVKRLTDVMVHNIFSPPVASRNYAYASIAAYEVMALAQPGTYQSLAGQLTGLEAVSVAQADEEICYELAAVHAYLTTAKHFIFTESQITDFRDEIEAEMRELGIPRGVFRRSIALGEAVASHIVAWSSKDNYKETRTYPRYAITSDENMWEPTPPDFMDGIEPHWRTIRPFVIEAADQFRPAPPTPFSKDKNSQFYEEAMEVYRNGQYFPEEVLAEKPDSIKEQTAIAKFWDCNPYVSHHQGHVMFATKKITPGGHWVNITAIAARKAKSSFAESVEAYALVGLALADGFISCWDEKYRSNLIRPETYISRYIDQDWAPLLQTPPFPEYTSGHSVISSAAAVVLTSLYGDGFAFEDTSEEEYGLPVRSFESFYDASNEAAISRLYGGIHYMPAIENGVKQGKAVGNYVVEQVKMRKGISMK